jgi:SNF2 family DNA or RNA helicase
MAMRRSDEIMKKEFKIAIADEAHYLKNRAAKRSK